MKDNRHFYNLLGIYRQAFPDYSNLLESIQEKFDSLFESISKNELRALKQLPIQYINKIHGDDGEWTSKLHIWAEQGVKAVLNIDPLLLSFKNSNGDTVLMSFVRGSLGSLLEKPNYDNIEFVLSKDFSYKNPVKDNDGNISHEDCDVMDELDLEGKTPLDHLIDVAFATGDYDGEKEDLQLQELLKKYIDTAPESEEKLA